MAASPNFTKSCKVPPGSRVRLSSWNPDNGSSAAGKDKCIAQLEEIKEDLRTLQRVLYAEHKHKLLIILQAMDTGGKDGTVRDVFSGIDPHGVRVVPFKAPTSEELDHDFLWRVHKQVPGKGEITIFNRSHYEDILAVRVKRLAPPTVWQRRYEHIVNFEQLLQDEGTVILKFFLHISHAEQHRRLRSRLDSPHKHWKFDPEDVKDRQRWPQFQKAYEDVISKTSTAAAPWFIIPANKKWYRNLVVASILRDVLVRLEMRYPQNRYDLSQFKI